MDGMVNEGLCINYRANTARNITDMKGFLQGLLLEGTFDIWIFG
jgi:hypothetical protein